MISSNTLFHVTQSIKNLQGILKKGFMVQYCNETFTESWILKQITTPDSKGTMGQYVPMVSFSDIPLSDIEPHFDKYNAKFAIGLSKEWGIKKGLNPVLYTQEKSTLAKNIIRFMHENFDNYSHKFDDENTDELYRMFWNILCHTKNYKGIIRKDSLEKDNLAYNEREWRYVPTDQQLLEVGINRDMIDILDSTDNQVLKPPLKIGSNDYLRDKIKDIKLTFEPEDVKYIIVENNKSIKPMINFLQNTFAKNSDRLIACLFTIDVITDK